MEPGPVRILLVEDSEAEATLVEKASGEGGVVGISRDFASVGPMSGGQHPRGGPRHPPKLVVDQSLAIDGVGDGAAHAQVPQSRIP